MPDTYKIKKREAYQGAGTSITFADQDGDKHEIILIGNSPFSVAAFMREVANMPVDENKFQQIQILKEL
jgi:hypothetical protein